LVPQDASIKDLTTVKQAAEAFVEAVRGEKLQCI